MTTTTFDDVVFDPDTAPWSQVCTTHAIDREINPDDLSIQPAPDVICGVKGCNTEAEFYVNLPEDVQEIEGQNNYTI